MMDMLMTSGFDTTGDAIMAKTTLMFGSIGTLVESSDIQRIAYNDAMREAGLDWHWDRDTYADLLMQSGGKDRLAHLAAATNNRLSLDTIDRIHARKTELACARMLDQGVKLRPGVAATIAVAKQRGMKLAFVTTTYQPNIDAVFACAGDTLSAEDFDYIGSREKVEHGKPAPDAYLAALEALGAMPQQALAVEDTALSVMSAKRAMIDVVATPGALTSAQDFWQADLILDNLGDDMAVDSRMLQFMNR
jgi:HAD superfamily hydrolase (TIGR01509 family)